MIPIVVPVEVSSTQTTIPVSVSADQLDIPVGFEYTITVVGAENFEGEYEYTPSQETQIIPIAEKRAVENITINPIPNNYGLITWNGSVLTVS